MLHLEYRPEELADFIGNKNMLVALSAVLARDKDKLPHSFLFTGPSGCGKTTLARITATMLGCEPEDFREYDAADFRGIDTVREIRRQMQYRPSTGDCRVWLLDECHKLTPDAQEAFLKAQENTPAHVYLIFATTEPEKLKVTFKRRCMTFEVEPLSSKRMRSYLKGVAKEEGKKVPDEVLDQIVSESLGSLGIALIVLDKVIDLPPGKMAEAAERSIVEANEVIELCRALLKKMPWAKVAKILKGLSQQPETIRRSVLGYFNTVLLNGKTGSQSYLIMDAFREPFYNTGAAGLTMACYEATEGVESESRRMETESG